MLSFTENPILMTLNPFPPASCPELPVRVFESFIGVSGSEVICFNLLALTLKIHFIPLSCDIATEEAERIGLYIDAIADPKGVEHVAQMSASGQSLSEGFAPSFPLPPLCAIMAR